MVADAAPIVRIHALRKRFGDNEVLKGIDLEVRAGEVVAIIGPATPRRAGETGQPADAAAAVQAARDSQTG